MLSEGKVGRISVSSGSVNPLACHTDGSLYTMPKPGKYYEAAKAGRLFSVVNLLKVATTAALATTWTGLGVCNPAGSGKNFIIHEFGWALSSKAANETLLGLMMADDTGMADALTAKSAMYGKGSSVALCDDGATIGTPILERLMGTIGDGDPNLAVVHPPVIVNLEGSLILPPDRSVLTYTLAALGAAASFYFLWEEVAE